MTEMEPRWSAWKYHVEVVSFGLLFADADEPPADAVELV
jgi:hypothetical protein